MPEPLVSVKMITYNHAPYIAQAIEGVLMQKTNFLFELVIGEDCSTDGTREIVFEYQKKYPDIIRVITSEHNVGVKKNGYRTTKACRGKYIAFCEGDDYWHHPLKLQKQVDYMESHPECGLVYSDRNQYVVESKKEMKDYLKNNGWEIADNPSIAEIISLQGVGTGTCTVMVRKNLIERIIESDPYLHQSDKFLMGDTQLWAELSVISNIAYIPESLATYRILPESASKTKNARKSLQWGRSFCDVRLYLCDKYNLPEDIRREIESLWCDCSLRLAFLEGNGKLALEVKMKKQRFTWKEWLRYLGAKYLVVNYLCRIAALSRNSFTRLVLGKRTG